MNLLMCSPAVQELLKNARVHASLVDPRIQAALEAMVQVRRRLPLFKTFI